MEKKLPLLISNCNNLTGAGVGIALGLLTFFRFRYLSPVRAAILTNVEPLLSIVFAAAILDQRLVPLQWIGPLIMVGAIFLFETSAHDAQTI